MITWKDKREFWIAGAKIADPLSGRMRAGSVHVKRGKIAGISRSAGVETDLPVLDAEGLVLAPGLVDIHTHLRDPGYEEKETIATGTAAAAAGGYTTVACMANTDPVVDDPSVVEYIRKKARNEGSCRVEVIAAVTRGLEGRDICEYGHLKAAGAVALSDDGMFVRNARTMRSALEYAGMLGMTVISHCQDPDLSMESQMNEGSTSTRLGLRGDPAASEEIAAARDIRLAELTGSRLHIAHVSTAGTVDLVRKAKERGVPVTAEATPHHLTLDETLLSGFDRNLKVSPPLRSADDIEALVDGLGDGTIDCISTDHAPHTDIDKQVEFDLAPPGMTGLETAFALLHTELVEKGRLGMLDLVRLMTSGPAGVLGLDRGRIEEGAPADLVLLDPSADWTLERDMLRSRSANTPLLGRRFRGRVAGVFLEGRWTSAII